MDWAVLIQALATLGAGGLLGTLVKQWLDRDKTHAEASKIWSDVYGETISDIRAELNAAKEELRAATATAKEAASEAQEATRAAQSAADDLRFVVSILGPILRELSEFGRDVSREREMLRARGIDV